ncbi:M16 family metallopeptidase [Haloimpatiens sp. FM7330]|uniref:M16 family metallopeptidase n=1 Tax=Haloimpatiens sp. FM7330 TaxID=3298610 RepID=UPI003635F587
MEKCFDSKEINLKNGIKLISIKKNTRIACINVGIKIGSLYENKDEKGISHFIEHMLFKGTKTRNNEVLNNELEQLGGEYNAYTDYTSTVYSIVALNEEIENSMELLADMVQNSNFDSEEIEKERGVILAEIRTSNDDIEDYSFKKINEIAFKNSPIKYDIVGEEKTVKSFSKEDLKKFYSKYYVPNNCYITIVSPFEHEYIERVVNKYFDQWKRKEFKYNKFLVEKNKPIVKKSYKKEIEQSTITYLYTFYGLNKEQELVLKILDHRFGASSNSILFRELREKRGLAYDVYTSLDLTKGIKTLYIYTAVCKKDINSAKKIIEKCITDIKNKVISLDGSAVELMKKVLKTSVAATVEDSSELCNYVLQQSMEDEDIYEFESDIKNLEKIKKEDIYDIAQKVFNDPTIHVLVCEGDEE